MERFKMTGLIFKTILLGFSLLGTASINSSEAASGDPAMAPAAPASAASAVMEAASPTTPAASAPKAAASAPKSAASAASAAASAPAAAASAATGEQSVAAAPATIEPEALSENEFYGFEFAIRDARGLMFDSDMNVVVDKKIWTSLVETEFLQSRKSKDENMFFDFGGRSDGGYEVITTNKNTKRSIMTVFKNKKPESQTIVGEHGSYTATESFCQILKAQTKSKSFEDLKSKAAMCSDFYAQTDESKVGMSEHIQTHRSNLERMSKSPAKAMVEKDRADVISAAKGKYTGWKAFRWQISPTYGVPSVKPRAILSKATSPDDIRDRQIVGDIAEACGQLWSEAKPAAKTVAKPAVAPAKTVKVSK